VLCVFVGPLVPAAREVLDGDGSAFPWLVVTKLLLLVALVARRLRWRTCRSVACICSSSLFSSRDGPHALDGCF